MKSPKNLFCCWVGFGLLLWSAGCNLHAFAVFPPNHQQVTQQALGSCCFEYTLPNGAKAKFSTEGVIPVVKGNFNIDIWSLTDEKFAEDYHFDDERFSLGQYLLLNTRDLIVTQLRDEAFGKSDPQSLLRQQMLTKTSREMLGNALHTLQDFYAHSNWVERGLQNGDLSINPSLGTKGKSLHGPTAQACEENALGDVPLTSGYYLASGVLDCSNICDAPVTECAHGNIVCPLLDCGINKDISTRDHYEEAFDLATQHTKLFVQKIFDEALSGDIASKNRASIAVCEFMGVPNPLSTCTTSYAVTVQKLNKANGQPTLEGLVQSSGGNITPAIDCGQLCGGTAIAGSMVVLTASNSGNWKFVRWADGGVCAGSTSPECSFTLNSNQLAKPEFAAPVTLMVQRQDTATGDTTAGGMVTSWPAGIFCGESCQANFARGASVTLSAYPAAGWIFEGWAAGGACPGSVDRLCVVAMDAGRTATARFTFSAEGTETTFAGYFVDCQVKVGPYTYNTSCDHAGSGGTHSFSRALAAEGDVSTARVEGALQVSPGVTKLSVFGEASVLDTYFAFGHMDLQSAAQDELWLVSPTLAPGTPVTLTLSHVASASFQRADSKASPIHQTGVSHYLNSNVRLGDYPYDVFSAEARNAEQPGAQLHSRSVEVNSFVGARISLGYRLMARVEFSANAATANVTGRTTVSGAIEAQNSGHTYFDVAGGADAILLSASGHNYSMPPGGPYGARFVVPAGLDTGACDSWINACSLQYAISVAELGDELWIAAGVYTPHATDRGRSFHLKGGNAYYGGFAGNESSRTERDPASHVTLLSGDLAGNDGPGFVNNQENSYHVVVTDGLAIIDGLTISGGFADGGGVDSHGGGLYNAGGSPQISNVTVAGNAASDSGGGIYNAGGAGSLVNVTLSGNSALNGAGIYNAGSQQGLTNVTLAQNNASNNGGGIYNDYSVIGLTNVTLAGNVAAAGGGIYNYQCWPAIVNSILWTNTATSGPQVYNSSATPSFTNSVIQGSGGSAEWDANLGTNSGGNLDAEPMLGSLADNGGATRTMTPAAGSSAIDTGLDSSCPARDQRGVPRPQGSHCDIGAVEYLSND